MKKTIISIFLALVMIVGSVSSAFAVNSFTDVSSNDWFVGAVRWAVRENVTTGMTPTTFGPNLPCTRAHFITFLWRDDRSPSVSNSDKNQLKKFKDVSTNAYYADALAWAYKCGVAHGYTINGELYFKPDQTITRAEAATFLWRALGEKLDGSQFSDFSDVPAQSFYTRAVNWLSNREIIKGYENGTFQPNRPCTRAEMVTMLHRTAGRGLGGPNTVEGFVPFPCG